MLEYSLEDAKVGRGAARGAACRSAASCCRAVCSSLRTAACSVAVGCRRLCKRLGGRAHVGACLLGWRTASCALPPQSEAAMCPCKRMSVPQKHIAADCPTRPTPPCPAGAAGAAAGGVQAAAGGGAVGARLHQGPADHDRGGCWPGVAAPCCWGWRRYSGSEGLRPGPHQPAASLAILECAASLPMPCLLPTSQPAGVHGASVQLGCAAAASGGSLVRRHRRAAGTRVYCHPPAACPACLPCFSALASARHGVIPGESWPKLSLVGYTTCTLRLLTVPSTSSWRQNCGSAARFQPCTLLRLPAIGCSGRSGARPSTPGPTIPLRSRVPASRGATRA